MRSEYQSPFLPFFPRVPRFCSLPSTPPPVLFCLWHPALPLAIYDAHFFPCVFPLSWLLEATGGPSPPPEFLFPLWTLLVHSPPPRLSTPLCVLCYSPYSYCSVLFDVCAMAHRKPIFLETCPFPLRTVFSPFWLVKNQCSPPFLLWIPRIRNRLVR